MSRLAASLLAALMATAATATEYDLSAYIAEPQAIAAAIGSNDAALKAKLEGMSAYVADNGLEERFGDPSMWRVAVDDIVAGRPRADEAINGFVLEILLLAAAGQSEPASIGWPFADLDTAADFYRARGFTELAAFLSRISMGNTDTGSGALPAPLTGKLGATSYHARVSVLSAQEAEAMLALLPQAQEAAAEIEALTSGGNAVLAERARLAIKQAETWRWTEYFMEENNLSDLAGRTVEQAIADLVASALEDTCHYSDALGELGGSIKTFEAWLGRASGTGRSVFFVYETN